MMQDEQQGEQVTNKNVAQERERECIMDGVAGRREGYAETERERNKSDRRNGRTETEVK